MKVMVKPWPECQEEFDRMNIPTDKYVDLSNQQMERISDIFDMMIRTTDDKERKTSERIMHLSPRGRGFGQR
jgi:hypothetical protein